MIANSGIFSATFASSEKRYSGHEFQVRVNFVGRNNYRGRDYSKYTSAYLFMVPGETNQNEELFWPWADQFFKLGCFCKNCWSYSNHMSTLFQAFCPWSKPQRGWTHGPARIGRHWSRRCRRKPTLGEANRFPNWRFRPLLLHHTLRKVGNFQTFFR